MSSDSSPTIPTSPFGRTLITATNAVAARTALDVPSFDEAQDLVNDHAALASAHGATAANTASRIVARDAFGGFDAAVLRVTNAAVRSEAPNYARYVWKQTGGGTDAKAWQSYADSNQWRLTALNDAESVETVAVEIDRTGFGVVKCSIFCDLYVTGQVRATALLVGGQQVVGSRQAYIEYVPTDESADVTANAAAINEILSTLAAHGLIDGPP